MIKFHKYIIVGMTNYMMAIIEPNKGTVLVSFMNKSGYKDKNYDSKGNGYTSIAYFFKGTDRELLNTMERSTKEKKAFESLIQRLRIIGVTNDAKLHIQGYPMNSEDNQILDLFPNLPHIQNTNKLPIIVERLGASKARIRLIGSFVPQGETPTSWLSEFILSFDQYSQSPMNKHSMGHHK